MVKTILISTEMLTDRANMITAIIYEFTHGLSIGIFRFDIGPILKVKAKLKFHVR